MISFLIGVCNMAIGRCRLLVVPIPEDLLLLGELFADAVDADAADSGEGQVTVRCVGEPRCVRSVGRVTRAEICIVDRHHDRAVLFRHRCNRVRVVGVGQVFLGVQVRREDERFPVAARRYEASATAIAYRELVAATAAAAQIER